MLRDGERIFLMKRTRAGGDERLHDRYTIGIGGHVNPGDGGVIGGLRREWHEEIEADCDPRVAPLGVLKRRLELGRRRPPWAGLRGGCAPVGRWQSVRRDKLRAGSCAMDEVAAVAGQLETWSALLFDFLVAGEAE